MSSNTTNFYSAVDRWLETCFQEQPGSPNTASSPPQLYTPPTSTSSARRKRTLDMSEPRFKNPQKRQRTGCGGDAFSEQSASDITITERSGRARPSQPSFTGRSSPKRTTSPARDLMNNLRVSRSAILCEMPSAILCEIPSAVKLPEHASTLQRALMEHLKEAGA